jgi:UDP-GlcNAc3NAcA epimerase
MKVLTVIGARPQFVKAAVVSNSLRSFNIDEYLVHSGQHFDDNMSKVFFDEMKIKEPDAYLGISGGSHGSMTGKMLIKIEELIIQEKPDWVLVYGDTNSTIAGALAAAKLNVPCAHVEAGLRSDNRRMPEEINRILTDHASDLLFAPTTAANDRLISEGIPKDKIVRTGDVMLDAAIHYGEIAQERSDIINTLSFNDAKYALCTLHRAENVDDPNTLTWIVEGLSELSNSMIVVLPLHPRTRMRLNDFSLFEKLNSKIEVIDPLGFLDILALQKSATLIVTDSGGMQKEAFFQKKPCVTVRSETEWVELLTGGHNRLALPLKDSIVEKVEDALAANLDWSLNFYGDGNSSKTIAEALRNFCRE